MRAFLLASLLIPPVFAHGVPGPAPAPPSHPSDARSEFRQLLKDYGQALRDYQAELEELAASENADEIAAFEAEWNPAFAFADIFAEAAERYAGTGDAVMFLDWILKNAPLEGDGLGSSAQDALKILMQDHREDTAFLSNVANSGRLARVHGQAKVLAILAGVDTYEVPEFTLAATFARGVAYAGNGSPPKADGEKACVSFKKVLELDPEGPYASTARGFVFELENLQIGMMAPDIEGDDLDGVSFKLSDYRGKVVFLDFWGDW